MSNPDISLRPNLERRVKNLALGPTTPSNALVPIFEAVYNALHAVHDRFGGEWRAKGEITITLHDFGGKSPSVEIRDNGIGLNKENFDSFLTYDSAYKVKRGGKGVGRLSWLKVFDHAQVWSVFESDGKLFRRQFSLHLDNNDPIKEYSLSEDSVGPIGTSVILHHMKDSYASHVPTKVDTIIRKMVAHFLPYLVHENVPSIFLHTDKNSYNLADFLSSKKVDLGSVEIVVKEQNISLDHNLLERGVVEGNASHKIYFSANERVVLDVDIGLPLGLSTNIERNGSHYVYAGVISSDLLGSAVNTERTAFDMDINFIEEVKRAALAEIKSVLSPQIERVVNRQADLTRNVIKKFPRFAYMVGDTKSFVESKLPRNYKTAEQIYTQLALFDYRENRDLERKVESLSKNAGDDSVDPIQVGVEEVVSRLTAQELSVLADYTVKRKVILDLLEKRLGYKPDGTMKHHAEEALHKFVVPMRATNNDVHIDSHNLWIIDDKLTYYEHWASDKQMKQIVAEAGSANRPDVLLFGGRTAYHRPGTDQPVVIIEFKKPARDDYNDDENPFTQIYGYIEELRSGSVKDKDGGVIQEVSEQTPFFCYIIADITPKLRRWLRMAQVNVPLPGGGGYYGYNDEYKAFIQALSYRYVLKDARLRNEAFFKRLKI